MLHAASSSKTRKKKYDLQKNDELNTAKTTERKKDGEPEVVPDTDRKW